MLGLSRTLDPCSLIVMYFLKTGLNCVFTDFTDKSFVIYSNTGSFDIKWVVHKLHILIINLVVLQSQQAVR